jgi:hypothetical protein
VSSSVVTSLSLLLRAVIANCRVDKEANKGKAGASQYYINVGSAVYAHKTKMLNPMPAALVPLITATRSIINTPPKKPVWKQFMVRNVPGFNASRMKSTMARTSMSRQMIMNSMKTTTLLHQVSKCYEQEAIDHIRNSRLRELPNAFNRAQGVCVDPYEEEHNTDSHDPKRHEHALLP